MRVIRLSTLLAFFFAAAPGIAWAGGTPISGASQTNQPLVMQQGSGSSTAFGDYTSDVNGLNTFYSYWVEVPPATGSLQINIYDRETGGGGGGEAADGRDRARNTFNTTTNYQVRNPAGTVVANNNYTGGGACDDTWCNIGTFSQTNPTGGHWEVRVSTASGVTTGDDINGYGIRAHDGTPGAGGTELNVYAQSFFTVGVNLGTHTRDYTHYPYVTRGCNLRTADFDWDGDASQGNAFPPPYGSFSVSSRDGAINHTNSDMSDNDTWRTETVSGWTTDTSSTGYGLFTSEVTIEPYATGNYGVFYFRNDAAAAPPPTAQPQANTYRIYLPADGGGAPSKAYVEQLLTYSSGPNPPQFGQGTNYTVTVRVVNPEAHPITFSTPNNIVTANIPGIPTVYGADAQVSQGSILSQPAFSGFGDITWNPGTVTAGATAAMSYRILVIPAVVGTRIPVTGTPSSNGTTARFADITGNTTQAQATTLFGPLCELAVTEGGSPTVASVSNPKAYSTAGGTVLTWETASEIGTASFEVERQLPSGEWTRVGTHRAPATLLGGAGSRYQYFDSGASGEVLTYRLIERESRGGSLLHGPYELTPETAPAGLSVTAINPSFAQADAPPAFESDRIAIQRAEANAPSSVSGVAGFGWADITASGMHRIPAETLSAYFGESALQVNNRLNGEGFQLRSAGVEVPWFNIDGGLAFYAEASKSIYSDTTRYQLSLVEGTQGSDNGKLPEANGKQLAIEDPQARGPDGVSAALFAETASFEQDLTAVTALPSVGNGDYWYWKAVSAGSSTNPSATFDFDLPGALEGASRLQLRMKGASSEEVPGEHHLIVRLNGQLLGEPRWTGFQDKIATFDVPESLLQAQGNQLRVEALEVAEAQSNVVWIDGFTVTYPRALAASDDALQFSIPAYQSATVSGFSDSDIRVFDLTSTRSPRQINGAVAADGEGFAVTLQPGASGRGGVAPDSWDSISRANISEGDLEAFSPGVRYLATTPAAIQTINSLAPVAATDISQLGEGADWLVIAPDSLKAGADEMASFRAEDGMATQVVSAEAIYAVLSYGVPNPEAIRSFLEHTQVNWSPVPRYVLLLGRGTFDHRDLGGTSDHLLTPIYLESSRGLASADPMFADFGDLGLPALAVGRLPVVNNQEVSDYVSKLRFHERTRVPVRSAVAVLADDFDPKAGDFAASADAMNALLREGLDLESYYLDELSANDANEGFIGSLNDGVVWANFVGHGAHDRMAEEIAFHRDDVPLLENLPQMPIVSGFSCLINRADYPGESSLGERLVLFSEGGSVASFAPTWVLPNAYSERLGIHFAEAMNQFGPKRIGDVILEAALAYQQEMNGIEDEVARTLPLLYSLIGDPATKVNM